MKINKILKKYFLPIIFFSLLITITTPLKIEASSISEPMKFKAQVSIPGLWDAYKKPGDEIILVDKNTSYIAKMIKAFYNYGIGIAGILAAIMLMAGGLIWLTSAGSSEKITQAKNIMSGSVVGLVILFGSWMLLRTINPALVDFRIGGIENIEKRQNCCHPVKGWVPEELIGDSLGCAQNGQYCADNESCAKTNITIQGTNQKKYGCLDLKEWQCCEYKDNILGLEYRCDTKLITSSCEDNIPYPGVVLNETYKGVICDPNGGGTRGFDYYYGCYYGGVQCCECKSDSLTFGFGGLYMNVACKDNLTAKECRSWCLSIANPGIGNRYWRSPTASCQSNGYCR